MKKLFNTVTLLVLISVAITALAVIERLSHMEPNSFTHSTNQEILEVDSLVALGFTDDEILSLQWLRQWYSAGGSDRYQIIKGLEFLKYLVINNKIEL